MHIPILYLQDVGLEINLSIMVPELTSAQNGYKMTQKLSVIYLYIYLYIYVYIYPGIQSSSIVALPRSHSLSRNLYIRIYSKPVVIGVKFNEESFKKGLETLRSFLYPL